MLSDRKAQLLETLINEYTRTAEPVGSTKLADIFEFEISPATVRLDLAELEGQGFLTHPHTSAGRIPTEKGYRFYIDNFVHNKQAWEPSKTMVNELNMARHNMNACVKIMTRILAEATGEAALAGFVDKQIFYTGLANLFSQPEFRDPSQVIEFSEIFDRMDEVMDGLAQSFKNETRVFMGKENPFGSNCSAIVIKIQTSHASEGLLGLVGPMRMDYERNLAILRGVSGAFENLF